MLSLWALSLWLLKQDEQAWLRWSCLPHPWRNLRYWAGFQPFFSTCSSTGAMSEREERRFVEIPRESVRLMAESTGLELSDEVAALLAEDVCYRLREATQVCCSPSTSLLPMISCYLFPTDMLGNKCISGTMCFEVRRQCRPVPLKESLSSQSGV